MHRIRRNRRARRRCSLRRRSVAAVGRERVAQSASCAMQISGCAMALSKIASLSPRATRADFPPAPRAPPGRRRATLRRRGTRDRASPRAGRLWPGAQHRESHPGAACWIWSTKIAAASRSMRRPGDARCATNSRWSRAVRARNRVARVDVARALEFPRTTLDERQAVGAGAICSTPVRNRRCARAVREERRQSRKVAAPQPRAILPHGAPVMAAQSRTPTETRVALRRARRRRAVARHCVHAVREYLAVGIAEEERRAPFVEQNRAQRDGNLRASRRSPAR